MVVETTHPHHAQTLASTVELSKCPDGNDLGGGLFEYMALMDCWLFIFPASRSQL
jgi:hypothetical protein